MQLDDIEGRTTKAAEAGASGYNASAASDHEENQAGPVENGGGATDAGLPGREQSSHQDDERRDGKASSPPDGRIAETLSSWENVSLAARSQATGSCNLEEKRALAARRNNKAHGRTGPGACPRSPAAAATCTAAASDDASNGINEKKQAASTWRWRMMGPKTAAAGAAFRARKKGFATATTSVKNVGGKKSYTRSVGNVKSGKASSRPETISANEPPHPGYMHSASRDNQSIEKEEKNASDAAHENPRPEMVPVREPPHPEYFRNRTKGKVSEEEKEEIVFAGFEGRGGGIDSPDFRIDEESPPQDEASAAVPTSPSAPSDSIAPGAVAVPGPDADSYGTTQVSRYSSIADRGAAASGDSDPDAIIVTAEAYAVHEDDPKPSLPAAMATVVERRTICGIDRARFTCLLAVLGIAAASILGVMAGTGMFNNRSSQVQTPSPTISSMPSASFMPTAAPTTFSPAPTECTISLVKLLPDDGREGDEFGVSLAIHGDVAVIGAYGNNTAYIFVRMGANWTQQFKLLPAGGQTDDFFGISVALHGDTVVVGASQEDYNGTDSGAAYIFTRTGAEWEQQAKLLPNDAAEYDYFGGSVAIHGDTAIVGASWDDDNGPFSGSAYVFTRNGTEWTQQAKLLPNDGASGDYFGRSLAIFSDTVIVGAPFHAVLGDKIGSAYGDKIGSAYVFSRKGKVWEQRTKLLPRIDDRWKGDRFGSSVAVYDDTIIVGADENDGRGSGSAYVFARSEDDTWEQEAKLLPENGSPGDNFGVNVAVYENTVVVGAYKDNDKGDSSGSAYVYTRNNTNWNHQVKILPDDGSANDEFGCDVAVDGSTIFVGADLNDDNGEDSGSVYTFELC